MSVQTFPFRYGVFKAFLSLTGTGPASSSITLDDDSLRVRMGWAFQADVPRSSITAAARHTGFVGGIGVHGWRGRWLVNGAATGVVSITIEPPARARVLGVRAKLRELQLSVQSPDALIQALMDGGVEHPRQQD